MIIWGSKGRESVMDTGTFNCPHCAAPRQYEHKKFRRWFTLYFIPVFPMDTLGEHIACNSCSNAYTLEVLDYDPVKQQAEQEAEVAKVWRSAMISVASAFGRMNREQADCIHRGLKGNFKAPSAAVEIYADGQFAHETGMDHDDVVDRMAELPQMLNHEGKEKFLMSAREVVEAGAGGRDEKSGLLMRLGLTLGMSEPHIRGVVMG